MKDTSTSVQIKEKSFGASEMTLIDSQGGN